MQTATLVAPDISCEHCKTAIVREIGALDGIQTVSVDIPTQRVIVSYDPARTSQEAIAATLDEEGYPVATSGSTD